MTMTDPAPSPWDQLRKLSVDLAEEADDLAYWAAEMLTRGLSHTDVVRAKVDLMLDLGQQVLREINRLDADTGLGQQVLDEIDRLEGRA